jgi:ABC-type sulfate transport system substrate-binding protein
MKLLRIVPSTKADKKMMAVFETDTGRTKTTHFGKAGMDDYTITHDVEQRERYRERHHKDLQTGDPTRAGFLSYYVLWGDSRSKRKNIAAYKNKFNL